MQVSRFTHHVSPTHSRFRKSPTVRHPHFAPAFLFSRPAASGILACRYKTNFMPRETVAAKKERTMKIIAALQRTYPDAHCELNFSNPLELLIATILSAQCTDKRVNIVTAELFKKYRTAADYVSAPASELEEAIKTTGFFRNKTKSIKSAAQSLVERHRGEVPRSMEELLELGGVGRKTANVVLGNVFDINVGVVVDTHVARL